MKFKSARKNKKKKRDKKLEEAKHRQDLGARRKLKIKELLIGT